jgi:hypothetical protein
MSAFGFLSSLINKLTRQPPATSVPPLQQATAPSFSSHLKRGIPFEQGITFPLRLMAEETGKQAADPGTDGVTTSMFNQLRDYVMGQNILSSTTQASVSVQEAQQMHVEFPENNLVWCSKCTPAKPFETRASRKRHVVLRHSGFPKEYPCLRCQRRINRFGNFVLHIPVCRSRSRNEEKK